MVQRILKIVVVVVGIGLMVLGGRQWKQQGDALKNAVEVDATIVSVEVEPASNIGSDRYTQGKTFTPQVKYSYEVAGTSYESTRMYPAGIQVSQPNEVAARDALNQFAAGSKVKAWVDPATPTLAFLKKEKSAAPAVLLGIGAAMTLGGLIATFSGRRSKTSVS